ncbi:MAG: hypothetical protein SGBAC_009603 [Bacillariaceae sp.]
MCFPYSCSFGFGAQFFSASWIRHDLGPRTIFSDTGIGLILDPSLVDVRCLYPTDAGTLARDKKGCGPMAYDRFGGSQGASSLKKHPLKRHETRKFLTDYKNMNFGRNTKWEDIDCMEFFDSSPIQIDRFWGFIDENGNNSTAVQYYSSSALSNANIGAIMGHDVCTVGIEPDYAAWRFPLYYDAKSWDPQDFKEVIDLEMEFIQNATTSGDLIWNEFVISLPVELPPLVLGIFYMNDNATGKRSKRREAAKRQAKTFGGLPVFVLHNEKNWYDDILECDETVVAMDPTRSTNAYHQPECQKVMEEEARIQAHLATPRKERRRLGNMHISSGTS